MAARKDVDDRAMRALLRGYKRPSVDREKFDAWMDAAQRSPVTAMPERNRGPAFLWPLAAAAALALLLGAGAAARAALYLDKPLTAYAIRADGSLSPATRSRQGAVEAAPGGELRFGAPGERVALGSGTRLTVGQSPWRVFGGDKGYRYGIASGSLLLIHDDPARPFLIRTPYGDIRPLGTSLSLKLDSSSMELACLSGRLSFSPANGGSALEIPAGSRLRYASAPGSGLPPAIEKLIPGSALPYAPAFPDIREVPIGVHGEWLGDAAPEVKASPKAARSPEHTPSARPLPKGNGPVLKELWSVPAGASGAARMEYCGDGVAILWGARISARAADSGVALFDKSLEAKPDGFAAGADAYLLFGEYLACLDWRTGAEKWRTKTGPISFSDIGAGRDGAGRDIVAVASANGYLYLVDSGTGALSRKIAAGVGMYGAPLIMADGSVVASSMDKRLRRFGAQGQDADWAFQAGSRLTGDRPLTIAGGSALLDADAAGNFLALDPGSGAQLWKAPFQAPLKRWPIPVGEQAAYQDARGVRFLSSSGVDASAGIADGQGGLLAAMAYGPRVVVATGGGLWLLDGEKPSAPGERLLKADIALSLMKERSIIALSPSGELRAWGIADE